jgi:hypothetical protein
MEKETVLLQVELSPREMQWVYKAIQSVGYVQGFETKDNARMVLSVNEKLEATWSKYAETLKEEEKEEKTDAKEA